MNRKRKVPKSKVAAIVHQQAKPYCHIFFICKGSLGCTRYLSFDLHASQMLKNCIAILTCAMTHHHFFGQPDKTILTCCCRSSSFSGMPIWTLQKPIHLEAVMQALSQMKLSYLRDRCHCRQGILVTGATLMNHSYLDVHTQLVTPRQDCKEIVWKECRL